MPADLTTYHRLLTPDDLTFSNENDDLQSSPGARPTTYRELPWSTRQDARDTEESQRERPGRS